MLSLMVVHHVVHHLPLDVLASLRFDGDGFDPSSVIPKNPPEGSAKFTNAIKVVVGWLMILGVALSVIYGMSKLGLSWWNRQGRQANVKDAIWAFIIAALISTVSGVLGFASAMTNIILSALN